MIIKIKEWVVLNNQEVFDFFATAKDWEYEVKKCVKSRSWKQNRYYWKLLDIVEQETGIDKDDCHEKMKMRFLYVPATNIMLPYCKSTSKLNSSEFTEYIENVKNFMAQYWIVLPEAD